MFQGIYHMRLPILGSIILSLLLIALVLYELISNDAPPSGSLIVVLVALAAFSLFSGVALVTKSRGRNGFPAKLWLAIVTSALTFAVLDLGAGLLLTQRHSPPMVRDPVLHHRLQFDTEAAFKSSEWSYVQRVNAIGIRGGAISVSKPPGVYRILMLGDSFTMGKGVGDNDTFSAQLSETLNGAGSPASRRVEVLNAGVDSYAPILSLLQLKSLPAELDADLVVLNLDMSDLVQEAAYRQRATRGEDGQITAIDGLEELMLIQRVRRRVARHFYVTGLALYYSDSRWAQGLESVIALANPEVLRHTLVQDREDRRQEWQDIFDSIEAIKRHCADNGQEFLLTIYPWGHQVNEVEWTPGRLRFIPENSMTSDKSRETIHVLADQNEIEVLDLFHAFRAHRGRPLYFSYDMHWTPAGHRLMSRELARYIEDK